MRAASRNELRLHAGINKTARAPVIRLGASDGDFESVLLTTFKKCIQSV